MLKKEGRKTAGCRKRQRCGRAGGYGIGQTEAGSRVKKQGRGVQRGVEEEAALVFV